MKIWPITINELRKISRLIAGAAFILSGALVHAALAQQSGTQQPGAAHPQVAAEAMLNAAAYAPWPGKAPVALDLMDNSDRNLALLHALKNALTDAGYRIDSQAPLVVTLDSREESGAWSDTGERTFLELRAKGGRGGGEDASARVNIFDSARGGLINEGQRAPQSVTPTRLVYELIVSSRRDGKRIWQAWANIAPQAAEAEPTNGTIAGELVKSFGKTVRDRTFAVR